MLFVLMNKEVEVLLFDYDSEIHAITKIHEIYNQDYAPIGIIDHTKTITKKLLNDWWRNRAIPVSRDKFKNVMEELNINSPLELLEISNGLSLSDQYWVKPKGSYLEWKNINFFNNDFSDDMGQLLFEEKKYSDDLDLFSPNNSNDGNLLKKWKIINGERYLIKAGNSFNNQEVYNEVVATKLYERLLQEDEFVPYSILQSNGKAYCACKTMVTTDEELVPAYYIFRSIKKRNDESDYEHYIKACKELGIQDVRQKLEKMIVCDYILGNYDRHYNNFGAIRTLSSLAWKGVAPIYDSGSSLFATTATDEIDSTYTSKPFKTEPMEQLKLVKDFSWFDVSKLEGFEIEFKEILVQNSKLSFERINVFWDFVSTNIKTVSELANK